MITPFGSDVREPEALTKNCDTLPQRHKIATVPTFNLVNCLSHLLPSVLELSAKAFDLGFEFHHSSNTFEIHARFDEF
jgi:hypothetical protein